MLITGCQPVLVLYRTDWEFVATPFVFRTIFLSSSPERFTYVYTTPFLLFLRNSRRAKKSDVCYVYSVSQRSWHEQSKGKCVIEINIKAESYGIAFFEKIQFDSLSIERELVQCLSGCERTVDKRRKISNIFSLNALFTYLTSCQVEFFFFALFIFVFFVFSEVVHAVSNVTCITIFRAPYVYVFMCRIYKKNM